MSLPTFGHGRLAWDADNTAIRRYTVGSSSYTNVPSSEFQKSNNEDDDYGMSLGANQAIALYFSNGEKRNLMGNFLCVVFDGAHPAPPAGLSGDFLELQYSTDTTNGVNGTWHHLHWEHSNPNGLVIGPNPMSPNYRAQISDWSGAPTNGVKAVRVIGAGSTCHIRAWHLYADTPNAWIDVAGDKYLGDVPIGGSVSMGSLTVYNRSTIARSVFVDFDAIDGGGSTMYNFAANAFLSTNLADWAGWVQPTIPAHGSVTIFAVIELPRAQANQPYVARIKASTPGLGSGFAYFFVDSIVESNAPDAAILEVSPTDVVVAGETVLTVKMLGAGSTAAEHGARLVYTGTPNAAPQILSWDLVGGGPNTQTGSRQLSPSLDIIDAEHIEASIRLDATAEATEGQINLYFGSTFVHASNQTLWPLKADPLPGGGSAGNEAAAIGAFKHRASGDIYREPYPIQEDWPADLPIGVVPSAHPQWMIQATPKAYVVRQGVPSRAPKLGAVSSTVAYARNPTTSAGLGWAEGFNLYGGPGIGADARWLPDATTVIPRGDVSSDSSGWTPKFNQGAITDFVYHATSAPFIDPNYTYYASGSRKIVTPAMIFPGGDWMQFIGLGAVKEFSWVIVAVLHFPPTTSWYEILSSPSGVDDPARATDCTLRYDAGQIQAYAGARYSSSDLHEPIYKGRLRPVIIGWSESQVAGSLYVVDALGIHSHDWYHSQKVTFDSRFWFGCSGAPGGADAAYSGVFDVLEVLYYKRRLAAGGFRGVAAMLNNIYGVVGR